jgi:D-alanine-D-alanine ligase
MDKKYLAFVFNVRHTYPDPDNPKTFLEADFDDPETIDSMVQHLKNCGYNVLPIEADLTAEKTLSKNRDKIGLVFNFSEVIVGDRNRKQITSVLEKLDIPHTGPSDWTNAVIRNKIKAKEILAKNGLPVLPQQVFTTGDEPLQPNLKFPLIVKPASQGGSAGITDKSIVDNQAQLRVQVKEEITGFKDKAFVEPFLTGREFSLPLLGNPPRILPIIEPNFTNIPKKFKPIDSYEIKWIYEEQVTDHFFCPAKIDRKLENTLKEIAVGVWKVLDIKDVCRIDLRCDQNGHPFVLDINHPAGLVPPDVSQTSYLPLSARVAGISYEELLQTIVNSALKRYKISL